MTSKTLNRLTDPMYSWTDRPKARAMAETGGPSHRASPISPLTGGGLCVHRKRSSPKVPFDSINVNQEATVGTRDGSVVKNTGGPTGGPGINSQHLHGLKTIWNSSYRASDAFFWSPWTPGTQMVHRNTFRQNIHMHKINR